MLAVICLLLFCQLLEVVEGRSPERVEVRTELRQALGVGSVDVVATDRLHPDQAGLLEHPEVLGYRRPADRKVPRQLGDRLRALPRKPKSIARGVAQRGPGIHCRDHDA